MQWLWLGDWDASQAPCGDALERVDCVTGTVGCVWVAGWREGRARVLRCVQLDRLWQAPLCVAWPGARVAALACGQAHVVALDAGGCAWGMGRSDHAQLGVACAAPQPWRRLVAHRVAAVACGSRHSLLLVVNEGSRHVWGCGDSRESQLGRACDAPVTPVQRVWPPLAPGAGDSSSSGGDEVMGAASVACGAVHSLVVTARGQVWAAGCNARSQLGLGHCEAAPGWQLVRRLVRKGVTAVAVAAGAWHCAAVDSQGHVWTWGFCAEGALGYVGPTKARPKRVPALVHDGVRATSVACGTRHTVVLAESGHAYAFGWNAYGACGRRDTPEEEPDEGPDSEDTVVGAQSRHCLRWPFRINGVRAASQVWAWAWSSAVVGDVEAVQAHTMGGLK